MKLPTVLKSIVVYGLALSVSSAALLILTKVGGLPLWIVAWPFAVCLYFRKDLNAAIEEAKDLKHFTKRDYILNTSIWLTLKNAVTLACPFLLLAVVLVDQNIKFSHPDYAYIDILKFDFLSLLRPDFYQMGSDENLGTAKLMANTIFLTSSLFLIFARALCVRPWLKHLIADFEKHVQGDNGVYVEQLGSKVAGGSSAFMLLIIIVHFEYFGVTPVTLSVQRIIWDSALIPAYPSFLLALIVMFLNQEQRIKQPQKQKGS